MITCEGPSQKTVHRPQVNNNPPAADTLLTGDEGDVRSETGSLQRIRFTVLVTQQSTSVLNKGRARMLFDCPCFIYFHSNGVVVNIQKGRLWASLITRIITEEDASVCR